MGDKLEKYGRTIRTNKKIYRLYVALENHIDALKIASDDTEVIVDPRLISSNWRIEA